MLSCQNDLAPLSIFEHSAQSVKFKEVKLKVKLCPFMAVGKICS